MMRLDRILRDYAEAGAVNAQIALWGFVDDYTFLTKAGHVGVVSPGPDSDASGKCPVATRRPDGRPG